MRRALGRGVTATGFPRPLCFFLTFWVKASLTSFFLYCLSYILILFRLFLVSFTFSIVDLDQRSLKLLILPHCKMQTS